MIADVDRRSSTEKLLISNDTLYTSYVGYEEIIRSCNKKLSIFPVSGEPKQKTNYDTPQGHEREAKHRRGIFEMVSNTTVIRRCHDEN